MIPENEVITFVSDNKDFIESLKPSFFEMTVAMAFEYFAKCNIDVAVIEVGLGGRLDSTNIITPVLSVITNIGHDHLDLLGDTFGKIAAEKAGIMKENVPVVISETNEETKEIFISCAAGKGSSILFADKRFSCIFDEYDYLKSERGFTITDLSTNHKLRGNSTLAGDYQSWNIQVVFSVFDTLKGSFSFSEKNILDGIRNVVKNTSLKGRWQTLSHEPLTICDTGHNKEGLEIVMEQLRRIPKSGLHMIIGFVNDKDLSSVLPLFPAAAIYYFTKASIPRALNEEDLKSEAAKYGLPGDSYPDVKSALEVARKNATKSDVIFIGGSTFIVAEVI
jgi:dihydrofolate synthase/folylpolyglutamate synthase